MSCRKILFYYKRGNFFFCLNYGDRLHGLDFTLMCRWWIQGIAHELEQAGLSRGAATISSGQPLSGGS